MPLSGAQCRHGLEPSGLHLATALVNPEAWALAIYLTCGLCSRRGRRLEYPAGREPVSRLGLASCYTWAVFGTGIGKALRRGWRARAFNCTMGLVLVSCAIWIMLSH